MLGGLCSEEKKSVFLKYPTHHLERETNKYEEKIRRGKRSQKDIGGALTNLCNNFMTFFLIVNLV